MNRRTFTKKCLVASSLLLGQEGMAEDALFIKKIPKTDTHVHLFDLDNLSYSWLKGAPEINRNFSIYDFQKASRRSNIGKIVFMESGAAPADALREATWVATLTRVEPRIKGIIAQVDLSKDNESLRQLDQLMEISLFRGVRGNFPKDAHQSRVFSEGMQRLARHRYSFDLLISAPLMETAVAVAQKHPDNVFILDHLGSPDIKTNETAAWKKGIKKLAALPNVHCKLSGMITRIGKDWSLEQLKSCFYYVTENFGTDRLVYGGDWPVVLRAGSYQNWSRAFEKLTKNFSRDELHQIYHRNADRIYNL